MSNGLANLNSSGSKSLFNKIRDLFEVMKRSLLPTRLYPIDDTNAHLSLNGYAIQAISDTVISSLTDVNINGAAPWDLTAVTIKAGTIIYVRFSDITLSSGECIVYQY